MLVVGPAGASIGIATTLGHRFSIVTVTASIVPALRRLAWEAGALEALASIRYIETSVLAVNQEPDAALGRMLEQGRAAIEVDGAEQVDPGLHEHGFPRCRRGDDPSARRSGHQPVEGVAEDRGGHHRPRPDPQPTGLIPSRRSWPRAPSSTTCSSAPSPTHVPPGRRSSAGTGSGSTRIDWTATIGRHQPDLLFGRRRARPRRRIASGVTRPGSRSGPTGSATSSPGTEAHDATAAAIWSGSHLDTVPDGGAFDGAVGSVAALECVRAGRSARRAREARAGGRVRRRGGQRQPPARFHGVARGFRRRTRRDDGPAGDRLVDALPLGCDTPSCDLRLPPASSRCRCTPSWSCTSSRPRSSAGDRTDIGVVTSIVGPGRRDRRVPAAGPTTPGPRR